MKFDWNINSQIIILLALPAQYIKSHKSIHIFDFLINKPPRTFLKTRSHRNCRTRTRARTLTVCANWQISIRTKLQTKYLLLSTLNSRTLTRFSIGSRLCDSKALHSVWFVLKRKSWTLKLLVTVVVVFSAWIMIH